MVQEEVLCPHHPPPLVGSGGLVRQSKDIDTLLA